MHYKLQIVTCGCTSEKGLSRKERYSVKVQNLSNYVLNSKLRKPNSFHFFIVSLFPRLNIERSRLAHANEKFHRPLGQARWGKVEILTDEITNNDLLPRRHMEHALLPGSRMATSHVQMLSSIHIILIIQ